jgi:hypothetical protein
MAYSDAKMTTPNTSPEAHNNQPIGLWVRREAIMAPTVEVPTPISVLSTQWAKVGTLGPDRFRIWNRRPCAVSTKESAHSVG